MHHRSLCVAVFAMGLAVAAPTLAAGRDPAARPLPVGLELSVAPGDSVAETQRFLGVNRDPQPFRSVTGSEGESQLSVPEQGLRVFFSAQGLARTIRVDPPFAGAILGVRLGDAREKVVAILGPAVPPSPMPASLPEATRTALEDSARNILSYSAGAGLQAAFHIGATGQVATIFVTGQLRDGAAGDLTAARPGPVVTHVNPQAQVAAGGVVARAGCQDPLVDGSRFRLSALELFDARTGVA